MPRVPLVMVAPLKEETDQVLADESEDVTETDFSVELFL